MAVVKVVGLGSPHGDDRAAWRVVEMLQAPEAVALGEPSRLLEHLDGCAKLVLVDACRSGRPPGTILRLSLPHAALGTFPGRSSHGLSVGAVLALAEQLGRLPPALVLYAIEAQSCEPNQELSPAVSAALAELCRRVRQELSAAPVAANL
jgi:hydrogenase maturation protease